MKLFKAAATAVVAGALMFSTAGQALAADTSTSATPQLTQSQLDQVRQTLTDEGVPAATIDAIVADPDAASGVSIPDNTTTEGSAVDTSGMSWPNNIGTCSGTSKAVTNTVYRNNAFFQHLASITLTTHWCYNGSRVTSEWSTRTYHVYFWGSAAVTYEWAGWSDAIQENFYTSNGHTNGGVQVIIQGKFDQCLLKYGCVGSINPQAETRVYYNGTYLKYARP